MSQNPYPQYTPAPPAKKKKQWLPVALVPLALVFGIAVGLGNTPPPVTVTKEVPGPERSVIKTVDKEVTPKSCLTAIDLSEQVITYAGAVLSYSQEAMMSASRLDAAGISLQNEKVKAVTPKLQALTGPLTAAKAECRGK